MFKPSRFVKRSTLLVGSGLAGSLLIMQCSFKEPNLSYEQALNLPLAYEKFTMAEIVRDDENLYARGDSVFFQFEESIDPFFIGDKLKIGPIAEDFEGQLGKITLPAQGTAQVELGLTEIYPEAASLDGQNVAVPSFSFGPLNKSLSPYEKFLWVTVESGTVGITIVNNLAVPLGPPLSLKVIDSQNGAVITSATYDQEVLPGQSVTQVLDLSGKRIPNTLAVEVSGASPGSRGQTVRVDAGSSFEIRATIGEITATEVVAQVPSQEVQKQNTITVQDSIVVTEAAIKSGSLQLNLRGTLAVDAMLLYEIPDFVSPFGEPLKDSLTLRAGGQEASRIVLDGYTLRPFDQSRGNQRLRFNWTFRTVDTGTNFVHMRSGDYLRASVAVSEVKFSRITGILDRISVDVEPFTKEIDIPSELDSVYFENARLELAIVNGINFPAESNLILTGEGHQGSTVNLEIKARIAAALGAGVPQTTVIVLDKRNSRIVEFLNALPRKIHLFGDVQVGDGSRTGTVSESDFVQGAVRISAPLALSLPAQSVESKVSKFDDLSKEDRERIRDNLMSARIQARMANHFPVGASAEIHVATRDTAVFKTPELVIGPITIGAGRVEASGVVTEATANEVDLALTKEQLRVFEQSPLYVGIRVSLPGTNGQVVRAMLSDYLEVSALGQFRARIDVGNGGR